MHLVHIFVLLPLTFLVWMFMENFLLVAMFEWLREFPEAVPRPQMLHVRLIFVIWNMEHETWNKKILALRFIFYAL